MLYGDTVNFFSSTQTKAEMADREEGYSYNRGFAKIRADESYLRHL
jgi:hypothetical protein